ncbi:MAG: WecB/TagA/CpsF family glycosyltransferase [Actinobacteria bacterium]|nr:WecB/TagA/CpsF family glycosyltransferase [Actinomycetota bacterium]MBI3687715.1 WecB/TagA/CpsF family glycosyltransferase [Actinomycetota bacterium]
MNHHSAPHLTVVPCAGVPITACRRTEAARELVRIATTAPEAGMDVHLCNAYTLALADRDPALHSMLRQADFNFPDGMSVVWANRLLHRAARLPRERVYGPDLFLDVFDLGQEVELRHYLLGGAPEVLARLRAELLRRFPVADVVGAESPPFRELTRQEADEQLERIAASGAQIVWLGLGTPKQDWAAADLASRHPAVFVAVGAAFDFVAGTKRQAPRWMQRSGLEWLFRLATEPRRLWRRYLFGNIRFIIAATTRADTNHRTAARGR